jgi:hypothetical protein
MGFDPNISMSEVSSQMTEAIATGTQNTIASQAQGGGGGTGGNFSTIGELKAAIGDKAYNAFMMAIGYQICSDVQSNSDNFIEAQRKLRDEEG